jgi:hypothetical protein
LRPAARLAGRSPAQGVSPTRLAQEIGRSLPPLVGIFLEASADDVIERLRRERLPCGNRRRHIFRMAPMMLAGDSPSNARFHLLRGHVVHGAEVAPLRQHDVRRLEIAMRDAGAMRFVKGGGMGTGRSGSYAYEYLSQGGLTFTMEFDYDKGIVKILNREISLNEINVVLVDFVDSTNGPTIVGYRWVDPAPPEQPSPVDPIAAVVKRTPELFEYLRCDLSLPYPLTRAMMPIICGQMRP